MSFRPLHFPTMHASVNNGGSDFGARGWSWVAECALALVFVGAVLFWHGQVSANLLRQQEMLLPGQPPATLTTGYRVFSDPDVYTWLTYAKQMVATGEWRINFTHGDNPPQGRETHWNSLLTWLLVAGGWLRALFTGESMAAALENAAFWVNAFLFFVACSLYYVVMRRLTGPLLTWVGLFLMATMAPIAWTFHPGRPDHQTLYYIAALGTIGGLLRGGLGWVWAPGSADAKWRLPKSQEAGRWFFVSAIFGAAGLWFGASVQITVLGFAGLSVLVLVVFTERDEYHAPGVQYEANLWSRWGFVGALATCAFFLLQYFPLDMRMRLESIHPFHALSWAGGGWAMALLCRARIEPGFRLFRSPWFALSILLLLVWPVAMRFGPSEWHILRDEVVVRFQTRTMEGMPLPMAYGKEWMRTLFDDVGVMPLLLLFVPIIARSVNVSRPLWTSLMFLWVAATGYFVMTYWQGRWIMHWALVSTILAPVLLAAVPLVTSGWRKGLALGVLWITVLGTIGWTGWRLGNELMLQTFKNALIPSFTESIYIKRLGGLLRAREGGRELHVIMEPTSAPALFYFHGIKSVGSLFWQNAEGLRDHRDLLVAIDRNQALEIVRRRRIDYVIVWENTVSSTFPLYLKYGESLLQAHGDFLVYSLVDGGPYLPDWLEQDYDLNFRSGDSFAVPLPNPVPQMRIYRVTLEGSRP